MTEGRSAVGLVRAARRPPGWVASGPPPAGLVRPELAPGDKEDLCFLSGDWRILQRRDGHRWSLDDLMTAWVACSAVVSPPRRYVDLGCGIGSVLMMVGWRFPGAAGLGVEAQELSVGLARRSISYNGAEGRIEVRLGDLREYGAFEGVGAVDLVTGTPPYFAEGHAVRSEGVQKGPCRFEMRGGVEEYVQRGVSLLSPGGALVLCAATGQSGRVEAAFESRGLGVGRVGVVPRRGKSELFSVFYGGQVRMGLPSEVVVRERDGGWGAEFGRVRREMGLPDRWSHPVTEVVTR